MKIIGQRPIFAAFLLALLLPVSGCGPIATPTVVPPSSVPTIEARATTTSLAPLPTLTRAQREERVRELLQTNAGCVLPCWWGIHPGATSATEADSLFRSMGAKILVGGRSVPPGTHQVGGLDVIENEIQTEMYYIEAEGTVRSIAIHALSGLQEEVFREAWNAYSPQNVLSGLGMPSRMWINSASSGGPPREGYGLWLFYDEEGVLIRYNGLAEKDQSLHICPTFDEPSTISSLELVLRQPAARTPLEDLVPYELDHRYIRDIEAATGLTIDEATKAILDEEPPCFDSSSDIWPM